jgi:negative regulator of sigma-B (phosphoserine phosphatase)
MVSEVQVGELLDVGVAEQSLERRSGDAHVAMALRDGALVAVIDGIGHGDEAADAAEAAVLAVQSAAEQSPAQAMAACHQALVGSRGAVASLAWVRGSGRVTWVGVGNVAGTIIGLHPGRPTSRLVARGGTLGHRVPLVRAVSVPIAPGDTLVLATDGVRPGELAVVDPLESVQANAARILAHGATGADDALVLVARMRTRPS